MVNITEKAWAANNKKSRNDLAPCEIIEIRGNSGGLTRYGNIDSDKSIDEAMKQAPTRKESQMAIIEIQNSKANGIDGIVGEAYKAARNWITGEIYSLYR